MTDDDRDFAENESEESFAELLEQNLGTAGVRLKPGQKVEATLLQLGRDWAFLDVGQKGEGVLDAVELLDENGNPTLQAGDRLHVYFLSSAGGEMRFTTRIGSGAAGLAQIEEAWRSGIPVEGRIEKEIKGGFEVKLPGGLRSFCPFSQLGLRRQEEEPGPVGESRPFRITQFGEQGRNIVVSHRLILEEEQARKREQLKETLQPGQVVKGTVTNIKPFGAFVDIGGVEGLIPISEVAYGHVEDIAAVLQTGQELEVLVKKCDWENNRFSFSLRETLADPWSKVGSIYTEGGIYRGTVARLTTFGAFVTLEDGIDGLIHISRLGAGRRIHDAGEVLGKGQELSVSIDKIDSEKRRISLLPVEEGSDEAVGTVSHIEKPSQGGMGTLGDLILKKQKERKKR